MKFKNQTEMFNFIWETRAVLNEFKSELTSEPLLPKGHSQWHWQFLHILPKGSYPKYKLNPDNIILGTVEEHENQEGFLKFVDKKEQLRREYYKEFYGKVFDN